MAEIMDSSPEMDLADPKTTELIDNLTNDNPEVVEKKDVKPKAEVSSTPVKVEEVKEEDDLESQVKGLKAELSRRQGNAEKVHELEVELARLQGEVKAKAPASDPIKEAIQGFTVKDLITKQTEWETELGVASAKWERADEAQNPEALRLATNRITQAQRMLTLLREEMIDRNERNANERTKQAKETDTLAEELGGMYDAVQEAFPDFQDHDSDLWKAGNDEYLANPTLMSKLGPAGEVVAAAMAIIKNPSLQKSEGNTATRKAVLKSIDKGFGKALNAGAASPNSSRNVDYSAQVNSGEGLAKFNDYIEQLKAGKR